MSIQDDQRSAAGRECHMFHTVPVDSQNDSQAHGRLRTMVRNCGISTAKTEPGRTVMDVRGR